MNAYYPELKHIARSAFNFVDHAGAANIAIIAGSIRELPDSFVVDGDENTMPVVVTFQGFIKDHESVILAARYSGRLSHNVEVGSASDVWVTIHNDWNPLSSRTERMG